MFVLFVFNSLHAQYLYLEQNKAYSKARIIQNGEMPITVKSLILVNDSVLQYSILPVESGGSLVTIPTKNVAKVYIKKGTYAGEFGLIMGLSCLGGAALGVAQAKNSPYYIDDGQSYTGLVLGLTAGGAAFGAIIGACIPKWKTYYIQDKSTSYQFRVTPQVNSNYCGIGLAVKF